MADPTIRIKRSSVAGKIPTPDQVPLGEIALNTFDGILYASKNVGIGTTVIAINPFKVSTGTDSYDTYFTAGNVGIGSTIPQYKLDVVGDVNFTGSLYQDGVAFSSGSESYWVPTDVGIHTISNVGVGTTNPTSALTVSGDAYFTGIITAKRFQSYWPEGSVDYNFLAGYESGELIDQSSDYNVLIGYRAGYDILGSDYNVAIGYQAFYGGTSNNNATGNIALGYRGLFASTTGDYNIGIGYAAGQGLSSGSYNTFLGYFAGTGSVTGFDNIAIGRQAAYSLTSGVQNTLIGSYAGYFITTGNYNVCLGHQTGYNLDSNQIGNTLLGYQAGYSSDLGDYNVCIGYQAGYSQESDSSIFIGRASGFLSGSSGFSVAIGYNAGYDLEGDNNIAIGNGALQAHNGGGTYNIGIGYQALSQDGTNSSHNIGIGYQALYGEITTTGIANIGIGYQAGDEITTGSYNVLLGNFAGDSITTGSNNVVIVAGGTGSSMVSVPSGTSSGQLLIGYNSDAWIRGDSSYNIGLGVENPTSKLHVDGSSLITGISTFNTSSGVGTVTAGFGNTALYVDGDTGVSNTLTIGKSGSSASINASGITTTSSSQFELDVFLKTSFRSAKYQIQVDRDSSYQTSEFLVIHDGTITYNTEFAIVKTGDLLSSFDSDISGNYVRLLATPTSALNPTNFKIIRTAIDS